MSELIKKVRMACAFGSPDKFVTAEIVTELEQLFAERDKLRAALQAILDEHSPLAPPEGKRWVSGGREEHCEGCDTGDPYDATPWSECKAAQLAKEALDG
jgi:hypothetical protein